MSLSVFPTLPGVARDIKRTSAYATMVQTSASGKEQRASFRSGRPRYSWDLKYNFLRQKGFGGMTNGELETLATFMQTVRGRWGSFLFTDPVESSLTAQAFGTGDASKTAFQLCDSLGNPVYDINGTPAIYRTDWQGTQRLYPWSRTNLLTYSQAWGVGGWTQQNVTGTYNATTAPDGTTTATKIVPNTTNAGHAIYRGIAAGTYIVSAFVKDFGQRYGFVGTGSAYGGGGAFFDLTAGTIINIAGTVAASGISSVGGGWFRVWAKVTITSGDNFYVGPISYASAMAGSYSYAGDGTNGIYGWGAQAEVPTVAGPTSYIVTTAATSGVTDYTLGTSGAITTGQAPISEAVLTWTGGYYRRCRFDSDELTIEQIKARIWSGEVLKIVSVLL